MKTYRFYRLPLRKPIDFTDPLFGQIHHGGSITPSSANSVTGRRGGGRGGVPRLVKSTTGSVKSITGSRGTGLPYPPWGGGATACLPAAGNLAEPADSRAGRALVVWQPSQEVQSFHAEDDFGPLFGQCLSPETFTNDSCLKHAAEIIGDYPGGQIHACSGQDYYQNTSHTDRTLANISKLCGGLRATENYFESKTYLRFVCR